MNIEKQVCTLNQAKRLKEFGINQVGYFSHQHYPETVYRIEAQEVVNPLAKEGATHPGEWYSAFTGTELGVMIGNYSSLKIDLCQALSDIWLARVGFKELRFDVSTEAAARAELLIYLLDSEILSAEICNKRLVE